MWRKAYRCFIVEVYRRCSPVNYTVKTIRVLYSSEDYKGEAWKWIIVFPLRAASVIRLIYLQYHSSCNSCSIFFEQLLQQSCSSASIFFSSLNLKKNKNTNTNLILRQFCISFSKPTCDRYRIWPCSKIGFLFHEATGHPPGVSSVWGPFVPMLYHRHHKQTTLWRPPSPQEHDLYGATPECNVEVRNKIKRGRKNISKWTKQIGSAFGEPTSKLINVILLSVDKRSVCRNDKPLSNWKFVQQQSTFFFFHLSHNLVSHNSLSPSYYM